VHCFGHYIISFQNARSLQHKKCGRVCSAQTTYHKQLLCNKFIIHYWALYFSPCKRGISQRYRTDYNRTQGYQLDTIHGYITVTLWVLFMCVTTRMKCNVLNRSSVDQDSAVLPFFFQINKCSCMFSFGRSTGVLPGEVYALFRSLLLSVVH
jgi:hypothetical protein